MDIIEIEDRLYRKNEVHIYIITPHKDMKYDRNVINESAKKLVQVLRNEVSQGLKSELIKELNKENI